MSIAQAVGSPQLPEQHPDLLDAAGCASPAYPGDGRARVAPLSVQNDHFCLPSAGPAGSAPAVQLGGSARGYQGVGGPLNSPGTAY
jgi:hypothetical protein